MAYPCGLWLPRAPTEAPGNNENPALQTYEVWLMPGNNDDENKNDTSADQQSGNETQANTPHESDALGDPEAQHSNQGVTSEAAMAAYNQGVGMQGSAAPWVPTQHYMSNIGYDHDTQPRPPTSHRNSFINPNIPSGWPSTQGMVPQHSNLGLHYHGQINIQGYVRQDESGTVPPNTTTPLLQSDHHGEQRAAAGSSNNAAAGGSLVPRGVFRPMQNRLLGQQPAPIFPQHVLRGSAPPFLDPQVQERVNAGFSANYRGNIYLPKNKSADIPEDENCSFFITDLPATVTVTDILASIRNTGRVWALTINKPQPIRGIMSCAATLTFFDRPSAHRFYTRHAAAGFPIHGHQWSNARVVWNRNRAAEVTGPHYWTRVLMIAGPAHLVNPESLLNYFNKNIEFQVDMIISHGGDASRNVVEFRFGSYRAQAQSGMMALQKEYKHEVEVWFGRDPCDIAY